MKTIKQNQDSEILTELLKEQQKLIQDLRAQLSEQTTLISNLQNQIDNLQRLLYGRKNEKRHKNIKEKSVVEKSKATRPKSNNLNGRNTVDANIERVKVLHEIPEAERTCENCTGRLHCIGKEVSEQLEYVPAKLIVKEHRRYKYGCRSCATYVKMAPMPAQPIDKGLAGPGLLSEIIISKYQDALPLYRQERRWERLGYIIPRSTQSDWVAQCAFMLKPIVDRMREDCLRSIKIHTDDTPFYVQEPNKTHTGRFWVYVGGDKRAPPCTLYEYSKTRTQKIPQRFFKHYRGYVQADAYPGYDKLYTEKPIIEVGCWAHARRKYVEVSELGQSLKESNKAINFIGELYEIETKIKNLPPEIKYAIRRHESKPILKKFKTWLNRRTKKELPKSPVGKAIAYTLNHWRALNHYLRDGVLEIDNNAAERAIKPIVIGRKNYLFAGSHAAAENAAVIYSIIETCKQNKVNTFTYLKGVLARLPTTLAKDIDQLLPYYWKPE